MAAPAKQSQSNIDDVDSDEDTYYDLHRMRPWDWEYVKRKKIARINRKFVEAPFYYAISAPNSFRPNSDYVVTLSIVADEREISEPVVVSLAIVDNDDDGDDENADLFRTEVTATIRSNATETIKIPVGEFLSLDATYKLVVKAPQGGNFKHEAKLYVEKNNVVMIIQTDKGIYRAGDLVRFRVFVLNENLRPAKIDDNKRLNISLRCRNGYANWKWWTNVNTVNGVFTDEFRLCDTASRGTYEFKADFDNQNKIATFSVVDYIPPNFETEIEMSEHYSIQEGSIRAIIRAHDENKEPIRGKVTVSVLHRNYYIQHRDDDEDDDEDDDGDDDEDESLSVALQTSAIDGHAIFEFHMADFVRFEDTEIEGFTVKVKIIDKSTERSEQIERVVHVHKNAVKIVIDKDLDQFLTKGCKYDVKISVRNHDDSFIDIDDSNRKIIIRRNSYSIKGVMEEHEFELNENGDMFYTFETMENSAAAVVLTAIYFDQSIEFTYWPVLDESEFLDRSELSAKVLTERCQLNAPVEIEVSSQAQLDVFNYIIIARQQIYETRTVKVLLDAENSHRFTFVPTFEMAPRVNVIIYYFKDTYLLSKNISIELKERLENYIELQVDRGATTPDSEVNVIVKSNPSAFVGLVGVDQSTLLLSRGNDLSCEDLWNQMLEFHTEFTYDSIRSQNSPHQPKYVNHFEAFNDAGLILFTNTKIPEQPLPRHVLDKEMPRCNSEMEYSMYPPLKKVRNRFPETWLWQTISSDRFNGEHSIQTNIPSSINSWIVFGFTIDVDHGLAITNAPTKQAIHKPFFVTYNLPRSAKCGDTISISCTVFNYLEQGVEAEVLLDNEHNEFVFVENESMAASSTSAVRSRSQKITILPANGAMVNFDIRPIKAGLVSMKVAAITATAGDIVLKTLLVED